jgi:hypothetical protein
MLDQAAASPVVAYPRDTFFDVVTMALEAALTHPSPTFTLRELENMLFEYVDDEVVQLDSTEFAAMVKLAMQALPSD